MERMSGRRGGGGAALCALLLAWVVAATGAGLRPASAADRGIASGSPDDVVAPGELQRAGDTVAAGITVPAGTRLAVALEDTLSTGRTEVGASMAASVVRPVTSPEGVAVPLGATVHFTPVRLEPSRSMNDPTVVRIRFDSLTVRGETRPIRATLTSARSTKSSRTGLPISIAWMAAAALAGALAGHWLTRGRGAVTGAALAAVAAAVFIMATQDVDAVIPAGAEMELRLDEPVEVPGP